MTQVPFYGLGMRGLNVDTPSHAQDHTTFNSGLNIRPYDGSLQAVHRISSTVDTNINGPLPATKSITINSNNPLYDANSQTTTLTVSGNESHGFVTGQLIDITTAGGDYKFTAIVISVISFLGVNTGLRLRRFSPTTGSVIPTATENLRTSAAGLPVISNNDRFVAQTRDIYGMTQWTNTSDSKINIAYLFDFDKSDTQSEDLGFQVIEDVEGTNTLVTGVVAATGLESNSTFDVDIFPFNDLLIMNDGTNQPIVATRSETGGVTSYTSQYILGWLSKASDDLSTTDQAGLENATSSAPYTINGTQYTSTNHYNQLNQRAGTNRVTCRRMTTYNNRLIALNISDNYLDGGNATMAWSTPITELSSLNNVTFLPATTNTAGDDIITETPGQILDAGQLSNYLMVYKSDSVFAVQDSGDPLFLISQQIFGDDGLMSPGCWADIGNGKHFVVGNNGIYIHDGGVNKQNVSKGRVEDFFFNNLRNKDDTFVIHHQRDKEVWICHCSVAAELDVFSNESQTNVVNSALVYNYELDAWHFRWIPRTLGVRGATSTNLGGSYAVYFWGGNGVFRLQVPTSDVDANGYEAQGYVEFDKHDLGDPTMTKRVHALYPHTENQLDLDLRSSSRIGENPTWNLTSLRNFDGRMSYKQDYRLYGRYYDLRIYTTGNQTPNLTGITFDITPGGRR